MLFRSMYFLFAFTGAFMALVKESGILVVGLCAGWLMVHFLVRERKLKEAAWIFGAALLSLFVYFLVLGLVFGGFKDVFQIFGHVKQAMASNDYASLYQEGPWYVFIQGLWILSPLALLAGLPGLMKALFSRDAVWQGIAGMLVIFCAAAAIPHYFKNLRYLSPMYASFYLLAGVGVWSLFSALSRRLEKKTLAAFLAAAVFIALGAGVRDYRYFRVYFIQLQVPDLSSHYLTDMMDSKNPMEFVEKRSREEKK